MSPKPQRSVEDLSGFVGWKRLLEFIGEAGQTEYYKSQRSKEYLKEYGLEPTEHVEHLRRRDQALIATLFETGGRINEVLMLRKDNFTVEPDYDALVVSDMPLLKRFQKEKPQVHYVRSLELPYDLPNRDKYKWNEDYNAYVWIERPTTIRIEKRKDFPVPRFEPMTKFVESWLEETDDWLFPTSYKVQRTTEKPGVDEWMSQEFGIERRAWISFSRAYQIVNDISHRVTKKRGVWNHWFRAMRASQLRSEYGWEDPLLNRFFGWSPRGEPQSHLYAQLNWRAILKRMDSKKIEM